MTRTTELRPQITPHHHIVETSEYASSVQLAAHSLHLCPYDFTFPFPMPVPRNGFAPKTGAAIISSGIGPTRAIMSHRFLAIISPLEMQFYVRCQWDGEQQLF